MFVYQKNSKEIINYLKILRVLEDTLGDVRSLYENQPLSIFNSGYVIDYLFRKTLLIAVYLKLLHKILTKIIFQCITEVVGKEGNFLELRFNKNVCTDWHRCAWSADTW